VSNPPGDGFVGLDPVEVDGALHALRLAAARSEDIADIAAAAFLLSELTGSSVHDLRGLATSLRRTATIVESRAIAAATYRVAVSSASAPPAPAPRPMLGPPAPAWVTLTPAQLRNYYEAKAFAAAGINPAHWDPTKGVDKNRTTIEAVYEYYAALYRRRPDQLWWTGMASLIGASFYGGFQDLANAKEFAKWTRRVATLPGASPILAPLTVLSAHALARELAFFETEFLQMQKEIFLDMATAHEAYLDGGLPAIQKLYASDPYNYAAQTIQAWRDIDSGRRTGNQDLIAKGNKALLRREQRFVINDNYEAMYDRNPSGAAITYLMTMIGSASVPGAKGYAEVFPIRAGVDVRAGTPRSVFGVPLPNVSEGGTISLDTPLPNGNIADFDDRWALIETDTLPVYVALARNNPTAVLNVLRTPIGVRAERYRMIDSLKSVVTNWDVDVEVTVRAGFG
jgi:hypothetical protein